MRPESDPKLVPKGPLEASGGASAASGRPLGAKADFGPILGPIWDPRLGSKIVQNRFDFRANFEHRCGTACVPLRRPPGVVLGPDLGSILVHFGTILGSPARAAIFVKSSTAPRREHDFHDSGVSKTEPK